MTYYQQQLLYIREHYYPAQQVIDQVGQSKRFIDEHSSTTPDLNLLARKAHFSRFHFLRLFKSIYGRTPHQYVQEVKIRKARQLLTQGKPVQQTSYELGFESPTSFAALFKKHTGYSPSAFAKRTHKI